MEPKVIMIEFDENGRPFAVTRKSKLGYNEHFYIEWCQRDRKFYAENSGNGYYLESVNNKFWLTSGYPLPYDGEGEKPASPENRLSRRPNGFGGDLWDWANEGECQYCSICDDYLPDDNSCDHI